MLCLIIPNKKSITSKNFDIYMKPLLEKLQTLWSTRITVNNVARYRGEAQFNLKAILLWTLHNFSTYGVVAGCVTKGYLVCHVCLKNTISRRSHDLYKNVYDNHYR